MFEFIVCLLYSLLNEKNTAPNVLFWELVHEELFSYRVAHHGYLLTSCPGQRLQLENILFQII